MNRHGLQVLARDRDRLKSLLVLHRAPPTETAPFSFPPCWVELALARTDPCPSLLVECSSASTRPDRAVPPRSTHHPASRALSRVRDPPPGCPRHGLRVPCGSVADSGVSLGQCGRWQIRMGKAWLGIFTARCSRRRRKGNAIVRERQRRFETLW